MTDRPVSIGIATTIDEVGQQVISRCVLSEDSEVVGKHPLGVLTVKVINTKVIYNRKIVIIRLIREMSILKLVC